MMAAMRLDCCRSGAFPVLSSTSRQTSLTQIEVRCWVAVAGSAGPFSHQQTRSSMVRLAQSRGRGLSRKSRMLPSQGSRSVCACCSARAAFCSSSRRISSSPALNRGHCFGPQLIHFCGGQNRRERPVCAVHSCNLWASIGGCRWHRGRKSELLEVPKNTHLRGYCTVLRP